MKQYVEPDKEKLSHKTLWKEAQDLLLEEPLFNEDTNLQNMDKEDALGDLSLPGFIIMYLQDLHDLQSCIFKSFI